jgi:hypothetical protein
MRKIFVLIFIALCATHLISQNNAVSVSTHKKADKASQSNPEVWIASTKLMAALNDKPDGQPFNSHWKFVSENIEGIKFWDFQISSCSPEELKTWIINFKELGIKIGYEKGRWPLPPDMYQMAVKKRSDILEKQFLADGKTMARHEIEKEAEKRLIDDQGEMLSTDKYTKFEEFAQKAAATEIQRILKIKEAGGLEILEFIEFDGAFLKNVFPYAFGLSQWGFSGIPESDRFKPGFESMEVFADKVYARMIEIIREKIPEASHVEIVHLPNIHLWTYRQDVKVETFPNGEKIYHNVDFKRLQENALDLHDMLSALNQRRDIFSGITTDYPYTFYVRPAGGKRFRGFASEAKELGFKFGCCINSMSGERSMQALNDESYEFAKQLHEHVRPDVYMVQSWFRHPLQEEIFESEDTEGSFMNLAKKIIELVKTK